MKPVFLSPVFSAAFMAGDLSAAIRRVYPNETFILAVYASRRFRVAHINLMAEHPMKLFKRKKFVWTEPWFFCQRIRDRQDWGRALLLALIACVLVTSLLFMRAPNIQWWQIVLLGLAAGAVVQFGVEAAYMRRDVSIDEDSIEVFGNAGQFTSYSSYPLQQIVSLQLRRDDEIGFPFSMLVLRTATDGHVVGIPASIRLERLAQTLHEMNVPVTLGGWEPAIDPSWHQNEYIHVASEETLCEAAQTESIPEIDRNLTKLPDMLVALLLASWFLLLWLGMLVWFAVLLYQHRQGLGFWTIGCAAVLMFASLTIPFAYFEVVGDYLSASYLIRIAKNRIQTRAAALIKSFEDKTFAVELINRETWNAVLPKVIDFGFLRVEPDRQRILYEGNVERWIVPFSAVKMCKIEEIQYGTGGENTAGELRCFVTLAFQKDSGPFEIGLRVADKDMGKNSDTRRMRKAVELFEYLVAGLAAEPEIRQTI